MTVLGCILAGGKGRRLGGQDKAVLTLDGLPLWKHVSDRLKPMVSQLIVTASSPPAWLVGDSLFEFVTDVRPDGEAIGPAGGLLAALEWGLAKAGSNATVLTAPVDAPFFPEDLYSRLSAGLESRQVSLAQTASRLQPAFGLWSCRVAPHVRKCIEDKDFAMHVIAQRIGASFVLFDAEDHAFHNINTRDDLARAESWVANR